MGNLLWDEPKKIKSRYRILFLYREIAFCSHVNKCNVFVANRKDSLTK